MARRRGSRLRVVAAGKARRQVTLLWKSRTRNVLGVDERWQRMAQPRVWNKRDKNTPSDAVYVGRPSRFGNPFVLHRGQDRAEIIAKYRSYIDRNPALVRLIRRELRGKDLVCWCAPLSCHADVLLEIANGVEER